MIQNLKQMPLWVIRHFRRNGAALSRRLVYGAWLPLMVLGGEGQRDMLEEWGVPIGEELVYRVYWGAVPVGEAVSSLQWENPDKPERLLLRMQAISNRAIAMVYPVRIDVSTLVNPETFLPIEHRQNRREGRRRIEEITTFDHARGEAIWKSIGRDRTHRVPIEPDTRDILTLSYFLRRHPIEPGPRKHHRVLADKKLYDLWLDIREGEPFRMRDHEPVDTWDVEPEAAFDGVFRREGTLDIRVSRDIRQILVYMRANIPVGSVRVELVEVRGPGNDFWKVP